MGVYMKIDHIFIFISKFTEAKHIIKYFIIQSFAVLTLNFFTD